MTLPDTPNVSLRDAIIWIAYGKAKPPEDFAGNALWLSREKEIEAAPRALVGFREWLIGGRGNWAGWADNHRKA